MLTPKYATIKEMPRKIEDSFEDIYFMQNQLIEETETMVKQCFDPAQEDLINFDAFQAICFLVISDRHIDLSHGELQNILDLLGVHPMVLQDTIRILKRKYKIPKNEDLLSFIRYIGPILLENDTIRELE